MTMTNKLKGQVAIITGGGRGIGRAIAEVYASENCNLVLIARTLKELEESADLIRGKFDITVNTYAVDIGNEQKINDSAYNNFQE